MPEVPENTQENLHRPDAGLASELERLSQARNSSLVNEFRLSGLELPSDVNEATAMYALGKVALPEETPDMPGVQVADLTGQINQLLTQASDQNNLELIHRLARAWAGQAEKGALILTYHPSVDVTQDGLITHSLSSNGADVTSLFAAEGLSNFVVDYGSGLNGVVSRIAEAKALAETSILLAASEFEAEVLRTKAALAGVPSGLITVSGNGIALDAPDLASRFSGKASLVVASRVHGAGDGTMTVGIRAAEDLLKPGGLMVLRGPLQSKGRATDMRRMMSTARQHGLGKPVYEKKVTMLKGETGMEAIFRKRA